MVILEHTTADGLNFFTLYGHLSPAAIAGLRPGQIIAAGQQFATLGTPAENGGWPPHLHLQVITDLLDLETISPAWCASANARSGPASRPIPT